MKCRLVKCRLVPFSLACVLLASSAALAQSDSTSTSTTSTTSTTSASTTSTSDSDSDSDSDPGGFGIGPRYTYVNNNDTDESAHMGGAFLRFRGQYLGVEGALDYRSEELGSDIDLRSWPVSASLLVYPIPVLYALAGLAWYNTTVDFPDEIPFEDSTDSPLGYHFGAGVEFPVSESLRLTSDVRWLFVDYEFEDIPDSIGEVEANSFSINAGLLFFLN